MLQKKRKRNITTCFVPLEKSYIFANMKIRNPLYIYIQLLFLVFSGYSCMPEKISNPMLLRADSLMECCADKALVLLDSIEQPQKMKKSERAFYALLRTKAEDKNYIEHTSDSLIKTAFDYYKRYGTTLQKMEVWYYLASVYRDLGDAPRAIDYFQQAAEVSKKKTEHELLCRTYLQMGTLFFYQRLPKEGVEAYKKSHHHALLTNDSLRLANSYIVMARVYTELDNVDSTLYYYKEAANVARIMGDVRLANDAESELTGIYLQLGKIDEVYKLLANSREDDIDFLNRGDLYRQTGRLDSAKYYYLKALSIGNLYIKEGANRELYELEKSLGQQDASFHHLEQYCFYRDSIQKITDFEGVKRVESLYAYQHIAKENNRLLLKNKQKIFIISGVAFFFLVLLLWLYLYFRYKKKEQEEQILRISSFKQQQVDDATRKLEEITAQKEQCKSAFHALSLTIHERMNQPNFKLTDEEWHKLQTQADGFFSFTARLCMLYPTISEMELRISLLIKAGIPPKNIANIVYRSKSSITNARKRLYEKTHGVNDGKAEQWDEFILSL